ncbi:MAG: YggS family pyridoxal phosphate-dependent enzyme [Oscillospiraceae bacterium]|nr:YggS family pyridoxal phosphate-dependent enzyme [Oscillospiraceae bacterium]
MTERISEIAVIENLKNIRNNIAVAAEKSGRCEKDIRLMAVTKTVTPELVNVAIKNGVDLLGENRVQEYLDKKDCYTKGCEVQFIGHLQTNKVKYIIDKVSMIQSVDSVKLATEISKNAIKNKLIMDILVEINIGQELSKSGTSPEEALELVDEISRLEGVRVRGLMSIPPICEKKSESLHYFSRLKQIFVDIGAKNIDNVYMDYLSMGMSQDYEAAIEMGANIVRIGSALFGQRHYQ